MPPNQNDIRAWIEANLEQVHVDDTTLDLFFFRGDERNFPFATVVTHDDEYDRASGLDREGVFRLNMAVSKAEFGRLFPQLVDRKAIEGADIDYRKSDSLFPHPVYGRMYWVSIINPDHAWKECQSLMLAASKPS